VQDTVNEACFKIALIDYGMGNIRSIKNALLHIGDFQIDVTDNPEMIQAANCIILPGVGAFPDAMKNLRDRNLIGLLNDQVLTKKKPLLGICLGMQLLFSSSTEGGDNKGLDWIPGVVERIDLKNYRVPHVGWNDLHLQQSSSIFENLGYDKNFYFVHSYHVACPGKFVSATFEYGQEFTAAVQKDNIIGMQFHPEKSQQNGMQVLKQFIAWAGDFNCA
jgi:imidazole glycerol-phosphate synthase subunit HisH